MRIAFVSHEFPPETGGGGIGTYLDQVTRLLAARNHEVEVFAATSGHSTVRINTANVRVHRIRVTDSVSFRGAVVAAFSDVHRNRPFEVCEGNDFDASALEIKRTHPRLPYVVKLHTPRFVIDELHYHPPTLGQRCRMTIGAWRRGQWPQKSMQVKDQPPARAEIAGLEAADEIAAPSQAIADAVMTWARIDRTRISVFPYPYEPPAALLAIPEECATGRVTFVGRLEERKGVLDLAAAVPLILRQRPDCRFRFIGRSMASQLTGVDMGAYLTGRLEPFRTAVEFIGPVTAEYIARALAETDVLVAPSHWESFGLVCCEGMAAARAVIGSSSGGMAEILDGGRCGLLVPPRNPEAIASAVVGLLSDPARRRMLGTAGRQRVLTHFSANRVLEAQLASYVRAIRRASVTQYS